VIGNSLHVPQDAMREWLDKRLLQLQVHKRLECEAPLKDSSLPVSSIGCIKLLWEETLLQRRERYFRRGSSCSTRLFLHHLYLFDLFCFVLLFWTEKLIQIILFSIVKPDNRIIVDELTEELLNRGGKKIWLDFRELASIIQLIS
jgi:hypothetical protein